MTNLSSYGEASDISVLAYQRGFQTLKNCGGFEVGEPLRPMCFSADKSCWFEDGKLTPNVTY